MLTVDSNKSSLFYAEETTIKTLPVTPTWRPLQPNSYSSFGGDTKTTMSEPITKDRQRFKGSVTDLDVKAGITSDVKQDNLSRIMQGFLYALAHEKATTAPINPTGTQRTITSVAAGSITASAAFGSTPVSSLLFSKGFAKAQNNSLTRLTAVAGAVYSVSPYYGGEAESALVAEAAPPATASVEVVGFALHGDVLLYGPGSTFGGAVVVNPLLSSAANVDFTTLGLQAGEWVYLGDNNDDLSDTGATEYNFFAADGTTRNRGYCRIAAISATVLQFDICIGSATWALGSGAGGSCAIGASTYASMYFGTVIHNELSANIVRTTYTLQRQLGKGAGNQDMLEYISGAVPDQLSLSIPSNNKLTADLSFVGMDAQQEYAASLSGTYLPQDASAAYNTASDLFAAFIYIVGDSAPLFGYATDQKLTINNNAKPNKALGVIGAFEANIGDFDVSGSITAYFDDIASMTAVRNNSDVGLTNVFSKSNAGWIVDLPMLTLKSPGLKVEKDKPIMSDVSHDASVGSNDFTLLYNHFSYLPSAAMSNYAG